MVFQYIHLRGDQVGLVFQRGEFVRLLTGGSHWLFDPLVRLRVEVKSLRDPWLAHDKLDLMVRSGLLAGHAEVLDLKEHDRALIWIDGRFSQVLGPGLYAYWTRFKQVRVEVLDARRVRFDHADLKSVLRWPQARQALDICTVARDRAGVLFVDGSYVDTLTPGPYAFWRGAAEAQIVEVDLRETTLDINGQEMMTADKVTLRVNALATYRIVDARQAVSTADNAQQALYREVQLALRAIVGARELDQFLSDKEAVVAELEQAVRRRAEALGLLLVSIGIRDVILPGEMKELMNKVTEAKKAAEANFIARREETAAMRSQANTARLLADNPTLMRLKELEVLEKIAAAGRLNVMLGEKGLADRVVNLL